MYSIVFLVGISSVWKSPFTPSLVVSIGDPVLMDCEISPVLAVYFVVLEVGIFKLTMLFPGIFLEEGRLPIPDLPETMILNNVSISFG